MSKFNARKVPTVGPKSAIGNSRMAPPPSDMRTHGGGKGWSRDAKSGLFLLAASFMGGDDNFYETEKDRYGRLRNLINTPEVYEDWEWLYEFINWLRNDSQMRTVALVVGIEAARARATRELFGDPTKSLAEGGTVGNRDLISIAMSRADEPAEAIAYWLANYGKMIPQYVKNGVADAAVRLYNEKSFLKYGKSASSTVSMRDVLRLTHPTPKAPWQNVLFEWITHENEAIVHNLPMITARRRLYDIPKAERIADFVTGSGIDGVVSDTFAKAGMTWENLSEWSAEGMTGRMWDKLIPEMQFMSLLRNLRNFDQAGISYEMFSYVRAKLSNPDEVAKSRQLPYRFYSAYRATESVRWDSALDSALTDSLRNIPKLPGAGKARKTLVLVDRSGSMFDSRVSPKSDITYADIAALFGSAWKLADPATVDLFEYGSEYRRDWVGAYTGGLGAQGLYVDPGPRGGWRGVSRPVDISRGGSILSALGKFRNMGGTNTHQAIAETWQHGIHSRLILITDEQSYYSMYNDLPVSPGANVYIWNLGGYKAGTTYSGRYHRHSFGGLNDVAFKLIPILEAGKNTGWPWEHSGVGETGDPYQEGRYGAGGLGTHDYFSMRD